MPITKDLLDRLLQEYEKPEELPGADGLLDQLTKALVERALEGGMTHHPGYQKHDSLGDHRGNSRNGSTAKTIESKRGQTSIEVPPEPQFNFRAAAYQKESDAL